MTPPKATYRIFRLEIEREALASTPLDYSKHIQKAEEAARRKNYDFAVQLFQQLLEIDPDVGEARAKLRQVLRKRQEAKKGGRLMKLVKGAGPLTMARGLAKAGKNDAAAKACESYLASDPMNVDANMLLGTSLESGGHFKSALAVFEFIAEIDPRNPEGLKRAGAMMARTGDALKALEYYERALEADPRDRDALKARKDLAAEAALSGAKYDKVEHSRDQIVDQEAARDLERAQRLHLSKEELEAKLATLEGRFAEDPRDTELMLEMARVHEKLRDPEAALDLAERAASYRKDDRDVADYVGALKVKALKKAHARAPKEGDQARADRLEAERFSHEVDELRRRLTIHPGDAGLRLQLGQALFRQGELDSAAGELQKAVTDPRRADEARFLLAQCFHAKGFTDLARKEYERVLETHPDSDERAREILYNLGAIAEEGGDAEEARAFYARVYNVDIGYRDVAQKMELLR